MIFAGIENEHYSKDLWAYLKHQRKHKKITQRAPLARRAGRASTQQHTPDQAA